MTKDERIRVRVTKDIVLDIEELTNKINSNKSEFIREAIKDRLKHSDKIISNYKNGIVETDLIDIEDLQKIKNIENISIFNETLDPKVLISSSSCTETELEEYQRTGFDVVIHGISRIISPVKFTSVLLELANQGISSISIPDNKQAETRLFRDFDFQALSNLMLLTSLIEVRVGDKPLKSETDVLEYCARASEHTNSARNNGFPRLTALWYKQKTEEGGLSDARILGYFKGALKELTKRAIMVQHNRTSESIAKWFSENKTGTFRKVDYNVIYDVLTESVDEAYCEIEQKLGITRNVFLPFYDIDIDRLTKYVIDLSEDIELDLDTECHSEKWHVRIPQGENCFDCEYIA